MSEASHFFAALVTTPSLFRKSLERAGIQAILATAGELAPGPQSLLRPHPGRCWVAFASRSENRESLGKLTERLVELFDEGGDWSLSFFMDGEELTVSSKTLEAPREGIRTNVRQQEWLRRFLGSVPAPLLGTLAAGGIRSFCEALGIPFLELADQDLVPWEGLSQQFPDRCVLDSRELSD